MVIYLLRPWVSGGRLLGGTATAHSEGARLSQEEQVPGRLSRCSSVEVSLCDSLIKSHTADLGPHAAHHVLTFLRSLKRRTLLPGQANPASLFHEY